jgi:hypothetical protein
MKKNLKTLIIFIFAIVGVIFSKCTYENIECGDIMIPTIDSLPKYKMECTMNGEKTTVFGSCLYQNSQKDTFVLSTQRNWFYVNPDWALLFKEVPADTGSYNLNKVNIRSQFYLTKGAESQIIQSYLLDSNYINSLKIERFDYINHRVEGDFDVRFLIKLPKKETWMPDTFELKNGRFNFGFHKE